jgi:hypothetical protein
MSFCATLQSKTMSYLNDRVPMLIDRSAWWTATTLEEAEACSDAVRGRTRTPTRTLQLLLEAAAAAPLDEIVEGRLDREVENCCDGGGGGRRTLIDDGCIVL